jgi:hypothetical protein
LVRSSLPSPPVSAMPTAAVSVDRAQFLFALAQRAFSLLALADILDHGDPKTRALDIISDDRNGEMSPEHTAVLADETFLHLEARDLTAKKLLGKLLALHDIVGMGVFRP